MRLRRAGGTPLPRRRPQVGPGLAGRGAPDRSGLGPAGRGDKCAELECSPQHRGEAGRSPSLRDRPPGAAWLPPPRVTCSRSRCQQPPAAAATAARRPLLPASRCAPPPAPPSRPGPPDADLAPPQPCGAEGAGPICSRARPGAIRPSHWPPPTPASHPPRPSPPILLLRHGSPLSPAPALCGLAHSQTPGTRGPRNLGSPRPRPEPATARAAPGRRQEAPPAAEALRAPAGTSPRGGGRGEEELEGGAACSRSLPGAGPPSPPGPGLAAGGGRGGGGGGSGGAGWPPSAGAWLRLRV
ncbi:hypothetical protein R6Z07M_008674 [Ovis aries]